MGTTSETKCVGRSYEPFWLGGVAAALSGSSQRSRSSFAQTCRVGTPTAVLQFELNRKPQCLPTREPGSGRVIESSLFDESFDRSPQRTGADRTIRLDVTPEQTQPIELCRHRMGQALSPAASRERRTTLARLTARVPRPDAAVSQFGGIGQRRRQSRIAPARGNAD
jgi:hypothetical protein